MPEDKIVISGSEAILCQKEGAEVKKNLSQLTGGLSASSIIPILPPGTKAYLKSGSQELFIVEEEPKMRKIKSWAGGSSYRFYFLSFPYVVYFIKCYKGNVLNYGSFLFFRFSPLASFDDQLFIGNRLPLLIDLGFGAICLNFASSWYHPGKGDVADHIKTFWNTIFQEKDSGFFEPFDKRLENLELWEKASRENPKFILNLPWPSNNLTVSRVLSDLVGFCSPFKKVFNNTGDIANIMMQLPEAERKKND